MFKKCSISASNVVWHVLTILLLFGTLLHAQTRLYTGQALRIGDGQYRLPLYLENPTAVAGLQFDLVDDSSAISVDSVSVIGRATGFTAMTRNNRVLLFHETGALLSTGQDSLVIMFLSLTKQPAGPDTIRFSSETIVADSLAGAMTDVVRENGVLYYEPETGILGETTTPSSFALLQNYPNPFNSETVIRFQVKSREMVSIGLYNIRGERVRTLTQQHYEPGQYRLTLTGDLPTGLYFYRMQAGSFLAIRKCLLIK